MRGLDEIKAANRNPAKFAASEQSDGDEIRNARRHIGGRPKHDTEAKRDQALKEARAS